MHKTKFPTVPFLHLSLIYCTLTGFLAFCVTFLFAATIANAATDVRPISPDITLMGRVRTVNADASTVMLSFSGFGMDSPAPCILAAHTEKDPQLVTDRITQQIHRKFQVECALHRQVRSATYPIFKKIADSGKLPTNPLAFDILNDQKDWRVIGLFEDAAICEAVLIKATEAGFGVKPCHRWNPRY